MPWQVERRAIQRHRPMMARIARSRLQLKLLVVLAVFVLGVLFGARADAAVVGVCDVGGAEGISYSACSHQVYVEASSLMASDFVFVCEGAPSAVGGSSCQGVGGSVLMRAVSGLSGSELVDIDGLWGSLSSAGWSGGGGGDGSTGSTILPELTPAQAGELFAAALPLLALAWVGWFLRRTIWRIGR